MTKKSKILFILPAHRTDLYDFLEEKIEGECHTLFFESAEQKPNDKKASFIAGEYFWQDYITPISLIKEINPDKIIFGEIFDIKQVALCVYANYKKIPTFFIDHGAAGHLESQIAIQKQLQIPNIKKRLKKIRKELFSIIRNRIFYYSCLFSLLSFKSTCKYLIFPFYSLLFSSYNALHKISFEERCASIQIIFSKKNQEEHSYIYKSAKKIFITGVPYFDNFINVPSAEDNYILFIDTPFYESGWKNWNASHHQKIAETINKIAVHQNTVIHLMLHPRSDKQLWTGYKFDEKVKIHQNEKGEELYLKAKLIIGFPSSVIIGALCKRKNIVLTGWHPQPEIIGIDFSKYDLCHSSLDIGQAEKDINHWMQNNLCIKNTEAYERFIKEYNYPFDGQAADRITQIINSHS